MISNVGKPRGPSISLYLVLALIFNATVFLLPSHSAKIKIFENGGLENGDFRSWTKKVGDYDVIGQVGTVLPASGQYMGIITNGENSKNEVSSYVQTKTVKLPDHVKSLHIYYNFLSNEYPNYVGTEFNDAFQISIKQDQEVVFESSSLNSAIWHDSTSGYNGETGWQAAVVDLTSYQGKSIALKIEVFDVGDSVVDSALLFDGLTFSTTVDDYPDNPTEPDQFTVYSNNCDESLLDGYVDYPGDVDFVKLEVDGYGTYEAFTVGQLDTDVFLYEIVNGKLKNVKAKIRKNINKYDKNFSLTSELSPGTYYLGVRLHNKKEQGGPYALAQKFVYDADEVSYIFLHGLNGSPEGWEKSVKKMCDGINFTDIVLNQDSLQLPDEDKGCYVIDFTVDGSSWGSGDGLTYSELGIVVADVVQLVNIFHSPKSMIFVSHSRGGIATRSFIQNELSIKPPYNIGAFFAATPHQGSPLGKIGQWLSDNNKTINDIDESRRGDLQFLFSPSVNFLAAIHSSAGVLIGSSGTLALNSNIGNLNNYVSAWGQMYSSKLELGENILLKLDIDTLLDLFSNFSDEEIDNLMAYLNDLVPGTWELGDGIVPQASAMLENIPGIDLSGKEVFVKMRAKTPHVGFANKEVNNIRKIVNKMVKEIQAE